jgi:hypothetical protein
MLLSLRKALRQAADRVGIEGRLVPYQLRHTYATSLLRAGVSLPALMKLLGHRSANMTLRYVEITQQDLQRKFHQARRNPRHLVPLPPAYAASDPLRADAAAVTDRLSGAIRLLDRFRQQTTVVPDKPLRLLHRALVRIRSRLEKLTAGDGAVK